VCGEAAAQAAWLAARFGPPDWRAQWAAHQSGGAE
jgi:hypothetical protein